MYPNINTGIGMAIASAINPNSTSGRFFIVCAAALTTIKPEIDAMYGNGYPDGVPIVYTTLNAAIAASVANRGDIILVAPGHTETVTSAAGLTIAAADAGVTIIGLGKGNLRPTITFTTSVAASFDILGAGSSIQNMVFVCGIDNQTAMVNVSVSDVSFINCEFRTNSATVGAALGILTAATSDRLVVDSCRFVGPATNSGTTTTAQIQYEGAVDIKVVNSYFTGKMTQAILNVATVLRGLIAANYFVVATGTKAIAVAAASTPFISNNRMNVASGTAPIVAAAGFVAGNVYSAAAGVTAGTASTI